jgi:hypothetical protein
MRKSGNARFFMQFGCVLKDLKNNGSEGLEQIKQIKSGMNRGRSSD